MAAAALAPAPASAGAGDHIRLGATTIAPELGLGVEFRSNVYRAVGEAQTGDEADRVQPGANFRLSPALKIETKAPAVEFDFNGRYDLRKYMTPGHSNLDRYTDFGTGVGVSILPGGPFGINIRDDAAIRNFESDTPTLDSALITMIRNRLSGGAVVRVGPGISLTAGGSWQYNDYRVPGTVGEARQAQINTRHIYGPTWEARWLFFPRTALIVEGEYQLSRWRDNWVVAAGNQNGPGLGQFLAVPDSNQFRIKGGLRGRITRGLVLSIMAGYGSANYLEDSVTDAAAANPSDNPNEANPSVVGFDQDLPGIDRLLIEVGGSYDFGFGQRLSLNYNKDFVDSYFTNYESFHAVGIRLDSDFGKRVSTQVSFSAQFEEFGGEVQRSDVFLRAGAGITGRFADWTWLTLDGSWVQRASSLADIQYDDVNVSLMANFTY